MGMEFKVNIGEEHNSNIDFNSLDEINKEYQETKRREETVVSTSSGNSRTVCLFDDNILQQISMMLNYLNMEDDRKEERKHERK